jgi:hypothetical protein
MKFECIHKVVLSYIPCAETICTWQAFDSCILHLFAISEDCRPREAIVLHLV